MEHPRDRRVIVNGVDEEVTVVLVQPEDALPPGDPTRVVRATLAPDEEVRELLGFCRTDNGIFAVVASGEVIDRWDRDDCPGDDVPDEWRITDHRPGAAEQPGRWFHRAAGP